MYARMLRLRYLTPSGFLCFVFLEGAVALGILLALAELVSWWGVLVLPAAVAAMVKLNDVITGALIRPAPGAAAAAGLTVPMQRPPVGRPLAARPLAAHPSPGRPLAAASPSARRSPGARQPATGASPAYLDVPESGALTVDLQWSGWRSVPPSAASAWARPDAIAPSQPPDPASTATQAAASPRAVSEIEVSAPNGSPASRQWMDQIDTGQRHRQSAARRYE